MLRYFNSLPFRFTVRHYYDLRNKDPSAQAIALDSKEAWDTLRTTHRHFVIPTDRAAWVASLYQKKDGQDGGLLARAQELGTFLTSKGITAIHSIGAGGGALEYFLTPYVTVTASDYNPQGVARLQHVFTEATVRCFDILHDPWGPEAVVMYRTDPQLSDIEWRAVFTRMHEEGVAHIVYLPSNFLTALYLYNDRRLALKSLLRGHTPKFAGYLRTRATFQSYWQNLYDEEPVTFGGMKGFYLTRKTPVVK